MDLLFEPEDSDFISTGDFGEDILSIIAVHPIREEALRIMVAKANANWKIVEELLDSNLISCIQYREERYYAKKRA